MMIWSQTKTNVEDVLDEKLELMGIYVATTSHLKESENDVLNFAKFATLVDEDCFHCLIFSKKGSAKALRLIDELSR
jgi:hypothetical protein